MGLDMYLRAAMPAPAGSALAKIVEEYASEEHLKGLNGEPGWNNSAYVSGWTYGNEVKEPLFVALSEELGFEPTDRSPSYHVERKGEGFSVEPTIYYWRKANAIHRWFVEKVQNGVDECQEAEVHPELLADLVDRCERITVDHDQAKALLPSQSGFFFGGTEYDEWYFRDVEDTARDLKALIPAIAPRVSHFIYQSSW